MKARRAALALSGGVVAAVTLLAGLAWACTNFIRIDSLAAPQGAPLRTTLVHGTGAPARGDVELRWNAVGGPVLARTQADASGVFSAQIQVPDVTPGVYVLLAESQGYVARAAVGVGVSSSGQPGYTLNSSSQPASSSPHRSLAIGIGVLALGLVGLGAGAVAVSSRRRRVLVAAPTAAAALRHDTAHDLVDATRR